MNGSYHNLFIQRSVLFHFNSLYGHDFTGCQVQRSLEKQRYSIGIQAHSHECVCNLLVDCAELTFSNTIT